MFKKDVWQELAQAWEKTAVDYKARIKELEGYASLCELRIHNLNQENERLRNKLCATSSSVQSSSPLPLVVVEAEDHTFTPILSPTTPLLRLQGTPPH